MIAAGVHLFDLLILWPYIYSRQAAGTYKGRKKGKKEDHALKKEFKQTNNQQSI